MVALASVRVALVVVMLSAVVAVGRVNAVEPVPETRADELQGVWVFVTLTEAHKDRMLLRGDRAYIYAGDKVTLGTFTANSAVTPRRVDLVLWEDLKTRVEYRGIYQFLRGNMLSILLGDSGGVRPAGFDEDQPGMRMLFMPGSAEIAPGEYRAGKDDRMLRLERDGRFTIHAGDELKLDGVFLATPNELLAFTEVPASKPPGTEAWHQRTRVTKLKWTSLDGELSFRGLDGTEASAFAGTKWIKMQSEPRE